MLVHWATTVDKIEMDRVLLRREEPALPLLAVPNDEVLIMVRGTPPFPLLKDAGVYFDPKLMPTQKVPARRGSGLLPPLLVAATSAGLLLLWGFWKSDYYQSDPLERLGHADHGWLRSAGGLGLIAGILATILIAANLMYLVRRNRRLPLKVGSMKRWMSVHIGTGMLALILAILHSGFDFHDTLGGHSMLGLLLLVATGAFGRYFYSFVPRAASGREQALEEALQRLHQDAQAWTEVHRDFGEIARREVTVLVDRTRCLHAVREDVAR